MQLSSLQDVFDHHGHTATVYLEGRSPSEDAAKQLQLRWRDLADQLREQGAHDKALAAIDDALGEGKAGWQQGTGRVLVAAQGGVLLDEAVDAAQGTGDQAYWAAVPPLGRYLREQAQHCRVLLVIADQQGATVRQLVVSPALGSRELDTDDVVGHAGDQVHKPRGGALSNRRIQNRVEDTVLRNAEDVIEHVRAVASGFQPDVLVLAGAVQARAAIRRQLPPALQGTIVETEHGARAGGAADEPLNDAVRDIAEQATRDQGAEVLERLRDWEHHHSAAQSLALVTRAAQLAAVETLLLEDGAAVDGELWIGPQPEQVALAPGALRDLGVPEPMRADAESALLRCCTATGSELRLVPAGAGLTDGVGALLRFDPGGVS